MPDASYYPSKIPVKPICIIDSGFWSSHEDFVEATAIAADPNQMGAGMTEDTCGHGTVSGLFYCLT